MPSLPSGLRFFSLLAAAAIALLWPGAAWAQSYSQTNRAFVPSPAVRAAGDAAAAAPAPFTAFFYNPAHLVPATHRSGTRLRFFGVRASASTNLPDQFDYFQNELQPAIDDGIDDLGSDRLEELYDGARALGRDRAFLSGDVLLPALTTRLVPGLSLGAGLFAHTLARYRFTDAGAGVPAVDFAAQGDLIGLVSSAVDFSPQTPRGLSLGLSLKYVRRYLSVKNKPIDTFEEDEDFYLLRGSTLGLDAGLYYALPARVLPGRLAFGAAAFDLFSGDFDYAYARNLTGNGSGAERLVNREVAFANDRYALHSSYRAGVAYTLPSALDGPFDRTTLAIDYLGAVDPPLEQSFLTHLRMGLKTEVAGPLHVRAGLTQGYPSAGAGLHLRFLTLDYGFYGVEEGRRAGQVPSWNHTLQLAFGLF